MIHFFFVISVALAGSGFDQSFAEYPVKLSKPGPKAKLQWEKHPKARKYRTLLRDLYGKATAPNFADHYVTFEEGIGCGTGCKVIFVVDWKTGEVFTPPKDSAFAVKRDSRLLILDPYPPGYVSPPTFYLFDGKSFQELIFAKP